MYRITRVKFTFIFIKRKYILILCALLWKQRIITCGWRVYKKKNSLQGTILPFNIVLLDWSTRVLILTLPLLLQFFWGEGSGGTTCRYMIFYWFVEKKNIQYYICNYVIPTEIYYIIMWVFMWKAYMNTVLSQQFSYNN